MLEPTKTHPIDDSSSTFLYLRHNRKLYAIPKKVIERYEVNKSTAKQPIPAETIFAKLETELGKAAMLLRGLRVREALSQVEFAKKIGVTQANLSNMENGRRAIGKIIAKRLEKVFKVDYRYFLE
ncbi:MAG TPA: helix-turn-helix transcriptional regulator [Coxiellaceae bacterium]|nr:helix-turn-helix transcriptional regulator [Coxiellaceae bacterium]